MSTALDVIRAEVEAHRTQPVDGAGVDLPTHAQRLASALAVGRVDQLAHELGNVLVPLQSALERLVRVLEPARGSDSFATAERALAGVARLCALHEACCREARGQDELRAASGLPQPEERRWRVPVTTEVQYIASTWTIDEHRLDAIKQKLESLRARAKLPDPLPVPDFGTLCTNAGRMSATPDPQPRMQNIPVGSGEHRLPELVLTTLNQPVSPEETTRSFAEKLRAHKDRARAALLELVLEPSSVDPVEDEEKP